MNVVLTVINIAITVLALFFIVNYALNKALLSISDGLNDIFKQKPVKAAMSILGNKSGESRRNSALINEIASGTLEATIGKYKPILGIIGIDLDDMLERYTPMEILGAFQTLAPMLPKDLLKGFNPGAPGSEGYGVKF